MVVSIRSSAPRSNIEDESREGSSGRRDDGIGADSNPGPAQPSGEEVTANPARDLRQQIQEITSN